MNKLVLTETMTYDFNVKLHYICILINNRKKVILSLRIFPICLLVLLASVSIAQISTTTPSGQSLEYLDEFTWHYTDDNLDRDIQDQSYQLVLDKVKSLEVFNVIKKNKISLDISTKTLSMSQAKSLKKKAEVKSLNAEIKQLQATEKAYDKIVAELTKDISKVRKSYSKGSDVEFIKKMASKYDLSFTTPTTELGIPSDQKMEDQQMEVTQEISDQIDKIDSTSLTRKERILALSKSSFQKPNKRDCKVTKGKNEDGKKIIKTGEQHFFGYTPKRLENYYKQEEYLICKTSVQKVGKEIELEVLFKFRSQDIKKSYGNITKGNFMRITLVTGKTIFLEADDEVFPIIEQYTGNTIYKSLFKFRNKEDIGLLKKEYVDKVGVLWSSGFEEYPIYNVNFFVDQLACIDDAD